MAIGLMISTFGAIHSTALATARLPFAMSRDKLLPAWLSKVTKKTRIPGHSVVVITVVAIGLSVSGTFDILTDFVVFGLLIFNGLGVAAIFVLRRRMPDIDRPYKVPGYPYVPALFLLATIYLMVNTLIATPGRAIAGLALIASGLPVYYYYARKLGPSRPEDFIGEPEE
jgi:APA family basic amino acid/polyamine antiporter